MINFIARSLAATNALKALRLSAELPVNIIIVGENGVGKKTLIKTVFKEKEIVAYNGEKNFSYTGRILIENIQYGRPGPLIVSQYPALMCSYPRKKIFLIILSSPLGSS